MEKYYKRKIDQELENWASSVLRKPLLLRGARQVGKTSAVHHLAGKFKYFAEIDFNERRDLHYLFDGTSYLTLLPSTILSATMRA